jgi:hypothetical protein
MNLIPASGFRSITNLARYNKIAWNNGNPYNLRWQYKWKHAYYTYPKDNYEHTLETRPPFWNYLQDIIFRAIPTAKYSTYYADSTTKDLIVLRTPSSDTYCHSQHSSFISSGT